MMLAASMMLKTAGMPSLLAKVATLRAGGHRVADPFLAAHNLAAGTVLNTAAMQGLLAKVVVVGILAVGLLIIFRAHTRNMAAIIGMAVIVLIGVLCIGLASGNNVQSLGSQLFHLIFSL